MARPCCAWRAAQPHDLRGLFTAGERVDADRHGLRSARAEVMLRGARVWRPAEVRVALPAARIHANLRRADACLARHRAFGTSVLEREAAPVVAALARPAVRSMASRSSATPGAWSAGAKA